MILKQRGIPFFVTAFLTIVMASACANYPDDPRDPVVLNDTYVVEEDTFLAVHAERGILANDTPREGEINYLVEVNGQKAVDGKPFILDLEGATVVLEADGSFSYEPEKDFNGRHKLYYTLRNEKGKHGEAECLFEVIPVNDPPLANDDLLTLSPTPQQRLDVLANDVDPDGDMILITEVGDTDNGSAVIADDGMTILFTPSPDHTGDVSFNYTVTDENDETAQAWVLLSSGGDGGYHLVQPDAIAVAEDSSITLPFGRLLANDEVNPDADIEFGPAQNGTVDTDGNRRFTYTPNSNFTGTDYFTYTVQILDGTTASATVTVTVTPVLDPPFIDDIPDQTTEMGQTLGPILFTVANVDSSQTDLSVTATVFDAVPLNLISEENISIVGNGESRAMWITPASDLIGTATIIITVSNGQTESSDSFQLTVETVGTDPGFF